MYMMRKKEASPRTDPIGSDPKYDDDAKANKLSLLKKTRVIITNSSTRVRDHCLRRKICIRKTEASPRTDLK